MAQTQRLSGLDLRPLPFESSLNILWRLSWRNVLDTRTLKKICGGSKGYPKYGLLYNNRWIDSERFRSITGWRVPTRAEINFCKVLNPKRDSWIVDNLRYCPLCLADGYHSFWHQCSAIAACPIHKLPLSIRCHQCNTLLPVLRFSKEIFEKPYICHECNKAISGAPVELEKHLHFREHPHEIARAFKGCAKWWNETEKMRWDVAFLRADSCTDINLYTWGHPADLERDIVYSKECPPDEFTSPSYRQFTRLGWRVKFFDSSDHWLGRGARRNWRQRTYIAAAVYKCTLRRLIQWIQKEDKPTEDEIKRHSWLKGENGWLDLTGYKPKLAALYLMRTLLEHDAYSFVNLFDFRDVQLHDEPVASIPLFDGRTPRLAWCSQFLAYYVFWYFKVLQAKRSGGLNLSEMPRGINSVVLGRIQTSDDKSTGHWAKGEVVFPSLERFSETFGIVRWVNGNACEASLAVRT